MTSIVTRTYRYRLAPTPAQAERLAEISAVCRFIYNLAWEQRRDFWRQYKAATGQRISFYGQCSELTQLRSEVEWVRRIPRDCQEYALLDLERAFTAFFSGRAGYPKPRAKGVSEGFAMRGRAANLARLNGKWGSVRLGGIGAIKFRRTRPVEGRVRCVRITAEAGAWFLSLQCERTAEERPTPGAEVGIDRGIAQTLTLSNGEVFQAPDVRALMARKARAQRVLARRKRGSGRHQQQRHRVAALAAQATRARTDWCHRTSTDIASRFGLVALESLNIGNMTASAAGTVTKPGRGVAQKRGLNRSILEQCWGKFAAQLAYKLDERGGVLISVPAAYTSQTCASCGVVDARSRKSQAVFRCVHCDHTDNADVNAAKEILRRSTAWTDMEAGVARLMKCQPGRQPEPASPGMLIASTRTGETK